MPARPRTQNDCHHDTKITPEAATEVIELLMMGGKTPETCWAVNKRQDNKLEICCIWLVIYLNCTMMHGLTNIKKIYIYIYIYNEKILFDKYTKTTGENDIKLHIKQILLMSCNCMLLAVPNFDAWLCKKTTIRDIALKYVCWKTFGLYVHGDCDNKTYFVRFGIRRCFASE
jgi:hypothetical protein